jgi:hypothetical protein
MSWWTAPCGTARASCHRNGHRPVRRHLDPGRYGYDRPASSAWCSRAGKGFGGHGRALKRSGGTFRERPHRHQVWSRSGYSGLPVIESGHPVPDSEGERAANELLALAGGVGSRDLGLFPAFRRGQRPHPTPGRPDAGDKMAATSSFWPARDHHEINAIRNTCPGSREGSLPRPWIRPRW